MKRTFKTVAGKDKREDDKPPNDFYLLNSLGLIHKTDSTMKISTMGEPFFGELE